MIFSFFHIWLAIVEFRREKSSTWHVASKFLKISPICDIFYRLGHGKNYLWFSSTRAPIFGGAPTIVFISMHAYARMKTVNVKGMIQGVVKYRYFSTPWPEYMNMWQCTDVWPYLWKWKIVGNKIKNRSLAPIFTGSWPEDQLHFSPWPLVSGKSVGSNTKNAIMIVIV